MSKLLFVELEARVALSALVKGRPSIMSRTLTIIILLAGSPCVFAQAPGVGVFDQSKKGRASEEQALARQLDALVEAGSSLTRKEVGQLIENPTPGTVNLPEVSTKEHSPAEIAGLATQGNYRVGWAYICTKCDKWHFKIGGGYAVAEGGVIVTCAHVIALEGLQKEVKQEALVVIDSTGKVHPVTGLLAFHEKMDAAVLTIAAETTPYALNDQMRPGDAAYCLSRPLAQGRYFSAGIVNRFFWRDSPQGEDLGSLDNLGNLKMNVSCRWAPGSSGSPVFDRFGNAIGHVALIDTRGRGHGDSEGKTLITIHTATPARAVLALLRGQKHE